MMNRSITKILLTALFVFLVCPGAAAQDQAKLDELKVLMDNLVTRIAAVERAYSQSMASNITRTMRLEVYNDIYPDLERYMGIVEGRTDTNSAKLREKLDSLDSLDVTDQAAMAVLEEILLRATVLELTIRDIGPEVVSEYVLSSYSGFVADRGDFTNPDFDFDSLTGPELAQIYFSGFGLNVLINMDLDSGAGVREAVDLYNRAEHIRPFLSNQYIVRGVDLDIKGIPLLKSVLNDEDIPPDLKEVYFGAIGEKIVLGQTIFGSSLEMSDEFYSEIRPMVLEHILIPDRLAARKSLGFPYGVAFGYQAVGPEFLLGLCGPIAVNDIVSMLSSDDFMTQLVGLESIRGFDIPQWPEESARLFELAEPYMASRDFAQAMLALEIFDVDSAYTGEPYADDKRERIRQNVSLMCDLMTRADDVEWVDYVYSASWWNIYREGSLTEELVPCMPMIVNVVNADWSTKESGENVNFPANEVEILTFFIPDDINLYKGTSDAVLGFLLRELDEDQLNQFTIWNYLSYLQAAVDGGAGLSDEWMSAVVRLKQWADAQNVLIREDELQATLENLLWQTRGE